jgi:DNA-binding NtrC family response regulator
MNWQESVGNVLIVDDNTEFQVAAGDLAGLSHCVPVPATTLQEARRLTRDGHFDLILIDLNLPDGNGLDLLDDIDLTAHGQIVVVTGHPTVESAVRAVSAPVVEYLVKPLGPGVLSGLFERAHQRAQLRQTAHAGGLGEMIGQSAPMQELFARIRRVAPLDVNVLVHGESGSGKELVARAVHDLSGRKGRFVAVNCGAIAQELLGSQLFGHERGAFNGAVESHAGYFEQAQEGTLFLDEISEMPTALQVYLLRVLEGHSFTRIGGTRESPLDVRVVAATNHDPQLCVNSGALRADLYYRLLEFPLAVPTLAERRSDIGLLAQHFLDRLNERYGTQRVFSPEALQHLTSRQWPGNVRELRYAVQRLYILASGDTVETKSETMAGSDKDNDTSISFRVGMTFDDVEREMLLKTLAYHHNNKRRAARALGITTKTIYNRLVRYRELGLIGEADVGDLSADQAD